jgi:hypothetical protein
MLLTGLSGVTFMVIALDVAGLPEMQVAVEVSEQVITSPLAGV